MTDGLPGEPGESRWPPALAIHPSTPDEFPADWRPLFLAYLYLALNSTMAFGPTDILPLTRRAKMLMMLESTISLLTMVIVLSRAVNALPG